MCQMQTPGKSSWGIAMKLRLIITFLCLFGISGTSLGQDNLVCTYSHYTVNQAYIDACGLQGVDFDIQAEKEVDSLFREFGLKRRFRLTPCEGVGEMQAIMIDPFIGIMDRRIAYPGKWEGRLGYPQEDLQKLLRFGHMIGHQVMQHVILKELEEPESELAADHFSGYFMARLGIDELRVLNAQRLILADEPLDDRFPALEERRKALKQGLNQAADTSAYPLKWHLEQFEANGQLREEATATAETARSAGQWEAAFQNYVRAFQHSGGTDRGILDEALDCAVKGQNATWAFEVLDLFMGMGLNALGSQGIQNFMYNRAYFHYMSNEDQKALKWLEYSQRNFPPNQREAYLSFQAYFRMGQKESAKESLKEAIRIGPRGADIYFNLGVLANDTGDRLLAIRSYHSVLANKPDYHNASLNLSSLYMYESNDMVNLLNQEADPAERDRILNARNGLLRKAEEVLLKGLQYDPDNQMLLKQLFNVYKALNDYRGMRLTRKKLTNTDGI